MTSSDFTKIYLRKSERKNLNKVNYLPKIKLFFNFFELESSKANLTNCNNSLLKIAALLF